MSRAPALNADHERNAATRLASVQESASYACGRIAPTWPLDRFIAVNPFWSWIDEPMATASAKLRSWSGAQLVMPRAWFRQMRAEGQLTDAHLSSALEREGHPPSLSALLAAIEGDEPALRTRKRMMDVLDRDADAEHDLTWREHVVHGISQFCASYFDDGQSLVAPDREGGLYASWRRHALSDRSAALLMGAPRLRAHARELPVSADATIALCLEDLSVERSDEASYLTSLLLDVNGWASWCAYRRWTARLSGEDDLAVMDLLGIRAAWEWMLHATADEDARRAWRAEMQLWSAIDAEAEATQRVDWILQKAVEIAFQERVQRELQKPVPLVVDAPSAQAVFCIDVRSEVMRRALESAAPGVRTLGFAGFFGLPIAYRAAGSAFTRPQLPGLLASTLRVEDTELPPGAEHARTESLEQAAAWKGFVRGAVSGFAFVEALGITRSFDLLVDTLGIRGPKEEAESGTRPRLTAFTGGDVLDDEARTLLAAGVLRGMSLTRDFARLVLLVGHGSRTRNNPHAAGLDCGACCGQTGEVNARAAAALLNEPGVRAGLVQKGILVPETTRFVAALHDTTIDQISLFEVEHVPRSHASELAELAQALERAGAMARAERAGRLGLAAGDGPGTLSAMVARSRDWAEVRPEWGLATNAAFVVGRRERTRHVTFSGRAFLHEYRCEDDAGYTTLEGIMTAPMLVTHWINLQYYASTVDNLRYGSGNKVLHNVVGGHLGVFEGNGGDLRIGLPLQSLHDGRRWVHEPLRLSVFIEAPVHAIDAVQKKHPTVRSLVENGWLDLFQLDPDEDVVRACRSGRWVVLPDVP